MEQDDPIVCEIPVHLADELRKNIYMVQFPLRPSYRPMPSAPRAARVKPDNQILQLDYDVDQRSEHFDKDAEDYLKQKYLRLQSSSVPALTNYTVGVFRQGQLHLTPVKSVLQMRPSLAHIDDAVDEEEDDDMEVTAEQEQKEAAAANEVKEVQFQFKKKQSERTISMIQSSYAYKKQQINAEQWRELQVMDKSSAAADEEFEHLFSEREDEVTTAMTPEEYLKALRYRTNPEGSATLHINTHADAEDKDEKMASDKPEVDAKHAEVLQILSTDHILHFDTLRRLLPKQDEDEILDALKQVAIHVRGRLLAKSSLVCRDEAAIAARNAILDELTKKSVGVRRVDVVEKHSLDPDATKKTLEDFAALDSISRMWTFKLGADESFAKRFSAVSKAIKL
uniref:DNA-directed RNA polymerase III subunit RPC5 n=1 Tax=Globisporangium ultimum (strain ATCC 200006 / CBS 805.95 / DAOM BR144) TaxID=431595 RepID=K3WSU3_GLOUD